MSAQAMVIAGLSMMWLSTLVVFALLPIVAPAILFLWAALLLATLALVGRVMNRAPSA